MKPCLAEGCAKPSKTRGLCNMHDQRLRRTGTLTAPIPRQPQGCAVPDCERPHHADGHCGMHNARRKKTGDPLGLVRVDAVEAFWARIDKGAPDGHWLWTGAVADNGYGAISTRNRPTASGTRLPHRVAWELTRAPIDDGSQPRLDQTAVRRRRARRAVAAPPTPFDRHLFQGDDMQQAGTGRSAPTAEHGEQPAGNRPPKNTAVIYRSGHCDVGGHDRCLGSYARTACSCACHTAPPPEPLHVATVRCFFSCPAVVACEDPQQAHAAMEGHYFESHREDIRRVVGWFGGGAA